MADDHRSEEPDRRTAGILIGGVVAFLVLTGAVNSMGGIDAIFGGEPSGQDTLSSRDTPAEAGQHPSTRDPWFDEDQDRDSADEFVDRLHDSGPTLSLAQQQFVAAVSSRYPQYASQPGRTISLADSICLSADRGSARPALIAQALVRNGVPDGAAAYVTQVAIRERCPDQAR